MEFQKNDVMLAETDPLLIVLDATEEKNGEIMLTEDENRASYAVSMASLVHIGQMIEHGRKPADAVRKFFLGLAIATNIPPNNELKEAALALHEIATDAYEKAREIAKE